MTEQIREQLSAFLDGELSRDEVGLLMRRLDRDPELRRSFGVYALIGETLRAPGGRLATPSFAKRVAAAIDAPQVVDAKPRAQLAPVVAPNVAFWKRPIVRAALAAGAAAAAVLLFRPAVGPQQVAEVGQSDRHYGIEEASFAVSPTPAQSQRLASYMVAHSQYSTPMVRRNVLTSLLAADPGITRVSYDPGEAP
jgi:sigma-E factor negative regulatory protein RseA